ncbi:MAG: helical backbone metal receptor [Candidatus Sericytochromatia bacterium]|nr:helical backbone metal receptor [Candidatus Sericytochromatia bacterium]
MRLRPFSCRQGPLVLVLVALLAWLLRAEGAGAASPPPARRILSLGPSLTEMVYALGLEGRLVGRTSLCNHPAAAVRVPAVGAVSGWNEERVVALAPDVILALEGARGPVERLARLTGARLVVLPTESLQDVGRNMCRIAALAGVGARGEQWAARLARELGVRRARAARRPHPSVFYMVWDEPLMAAGPRSYLGDLIAVAGGRNVVPDSVRASYPTFGWEALVAADPEVVLAPQERAPALARLATRHPGVRAVQAGRLHTLPDDLVSRPGPRVLEALTAIERALRPPR